MLVKTFSDSEIKRLIKQTEPILQEYIKKLKDSLENQKKITGKSILKLREQEKAITGDKHDV